MERKLKILLEHLKQRQKEYILNYRKSELATESFSYYGGSLAFAEAARILTDILNSENPNSVSNQPTEE
jgi:hypothetical protein